MVIGMIVKIIVNEEDDYVNNYNGDRLTKELNDYIIDELKGVPLKDKLSIEVYGNCLIDKKNQEKFIRLYRNNFKTDMNDYVMYFKVSLIMSIILCLFGILFIIFSNIINVSLVKEILLIIGWVGVWESVYNTLFVESKNLFTIRRYNKISNAIIIFKH